MVSALVIGKHVVIALAKISPLLGGALILLSFQAVTPSISDAWRIGMSIVMGVFVTLVGAVYKNMNDRVNGLERKQEHFMTRHEYEGRHEDLKDQLNRIESKLSIVRR